MAAGNRSVKLLSLQIDSPEGGRVRAEVRWEYRIEDNVGKDTVVQGGNLALDLGTTAVASAMTLAQIRTAALAKLATDGTIPSHDARS